MNSLLALLLALLLAPLAVSHAAELQLASVFADHAVLQRDKPVPVWGWCDAGAKVTVEFGGQTKTAVADASGKWLVRLDAVAASETPRMLVVTCGAWRVTRADILVGEVWLCAGQSNMAMTVDGQTKWLHVGGIANAKAVVRDSANRLLRQFSVDWKTDTTPQRDCAGKWSIAGPDESRGAGTRVGCRVCREDEPAY